LKRRILLSLLLALGMLAGWRGMIVTWSRPAALLTRGPYLQSVTSDGVVVVWETDVPGDSRVDYGPTASYGLTASDATPVTHHAVALTGLAPYTRTHYRVSTDGQPLGSDNTFRTAALPGAQAAFTFVAFGDTRTNVDAHQRVADSILELAPDFVLHVGDFVEDGGSASQWTTFFTVEQDLLRQTPLFGVLGNHENDSVKYFDAFHFPGNERWYSFDYGNVHFVALEIDGDSNYGPGSGQALWLENDLAHTNQQWKVVFFHVPPYSAGAHGSDLGVRTALEPLFRQYGVALVFNGHDHDYERSVANGIVYIVAGGGGAPLGSEANSNPASAYFTGTYQSVLVTVTDSVLTTTGVRADGLRFDEFTLRKLPPRCFLPAVLKRK
jgi:predicted phosphodiesterase